MAVCFSTTVRRYDMSSMCLRVYQCRNTSLTAAMMEQKEAGALRCCDVCLDASLPFFDVIEISVVLPSSSRRLQHMMAVGVAFTSLGEMYLQFTET